MKGNLPTYRKNPPKMGGFSCKHGWTDPEPSCKGFSIKNRYKGVTFLIDLFSMVFVNYSYHNP